MTSTVTTGTPKTAVNLQRGEFANEAFIDFSKAENRKAMEEALAQVRGMFGREYPLTIGGERITTTEKIKSYNPSHPEQVIGVFQKATVEMANQAVEKAAAAFERWKRVPVEERVACLYRAADILRKRRYLRPRSHRFPRPLGQSHVQIRSRRFWIVLRAFQRRQFNR